MGIGCSVSWNFVGPEEKPLKNQRPEPNLEYCVDVKGKSNSTGTVIITLLVTCFFIILM